MLAVYTRICARSEDGIHVRNLPLPLNSPILKPPLREPGAAVLALHIQPLGCFLSPTPVMLNFKSASQCRGRKQKWVLFSWDQRALAQPPKEEASNRYYG